VKSIQMLHVLFGVLRAFGEFLWNAMTFSYNFKVIDRQS